MNLNSMTESSIRILLGSCGIKICLSGRPQNMVFILKYHTKIQIVKRVRRLFQHQLHPFIVTFLYVAVVVLSLLQSNQQPISTQNEPNSNMFT